MSHYFRVYWDLFAIFSVCLVFLACLGMPLQQNVKQSFNTDSKQ